MILGSSLFSLSIFRTNGAIFSLEIFAANSLNASSSSLSIFNGKCDEAKVRWVHICTDFLHN